MAVYIMRGHPKYNFYATELFDTNLEVGRRSLNNISSSWAKLKYPNAKYVANNIVIHKDTGLIDFVQIYF